MCLDPHQVSPLISFSFIVSIYFNAEMPSKQPKKSMEKVPDFVEGNSEHYLFSTF